MHRDFPLSQLRRVDVYFKGNHIPSSHYMHVDQVGIFMSATINLHHGVGNIHLESGKQKLDNLWRIRIVEFPLQTSSYWWCVPDLQRNGDPNGAQINDSTSGVDVWRHPELVKEDEKAEWME